MAGRPNDPGAIARHVQGLRALKAKFQAFPEIVREHLNIANELTVKEIKRQAQARLEASPSIRTRALYNAVDYRVTKSNGTARVGVTSGSTVLNVGGTRVRVKGVIVSGRGGSALTSQGAMLIRPSRYAHLVEFGASHMPAEPFMLPAAESQRGAYVERVKAAKAGIVRDVSNVGAGLL